MTHNNNTTDIIYSLQHFDSSPALLSIKVNSKNNNTDNNNNGNPHFDDPTQLSASVKEHHHHPPKMLNSWPLPVQLLPG